MDDLRVARELMAVAKELTAYSVRKRATIILDKRDFRDLSVWGSMLEQMGVPHGEESDWNDPETVELTVVGAKAY